MIKTNKKGSLIVISGPSGVGKDSIVAEVMKTNLPNLQLSISATTRNIRNGETEGIDYYFITKEEFERKIANDDLLEYAIYNDNYYGTPKSAVDEALNKEIDVILVIEVQGAVKIKNLFPEAIFIFLVPPTMQELKSRLIGRGTDNLEKVYSRFKTAYKEINELNKYNYVVVNDDLAKAANTVNSIIISEKCRVDRIEEIDLGSEEELIHEILVDMQEDK